MSWESLILFVLALFVWGISVAGRWLQEQMAKTSSSGNEFEPIEWSPHPEFEEMTRGEALALLDGLQQKNSPTFIPSQIIRQKKTVRRLGLGRPQTLRQGIILMTVLGPCRALEQSKDSTPF